MRRHDLPSPSQPVRVPSGKPVARELFPQTGGQGGSLTAAALGRAEASLEGWRVVDTLLGAASEDGRQGAVRVARDRGLDMGPALGQLETSGPLVVNLTLERRRSFEAQLAGAREEVRQHIGELERDIGELMRHAPSTRAADRDADRAVHVVAPDIAPPTPTRS